MKTQNYLLKFLSLISFLIVLNNVGYSIAPQISIDALAEDTICPYVDPELSLTNNKSGEWTYKWKLTKGTPATYTGSSPSVNWTVEGTFMITLIAEEWDEANPPPFNPISTDYDTIYITIDGTCCQDLPEITTFVDGRTYDSVYYIDDDITLGQSDRILLTGTFLLDGDITTTIPGGSVDGPTLFLDDDSEFSVENGSLRGYCSRMWNGIEVDDDATVIFDNAYFSDAFEGIFYTSTISDNYYFEIENSTFFNNRKCITTQGSNFSFGDYLVSDSDFDCDPRTMLEPLIYDDGHNARQEYRMVYALKFNGDNRVEYDYFKGNTFSNSLVGIDFNSTTSKAFCIKNCQFYNNKMTGVLTRTSDFAVYIENNQFWLPTEINTNFDQYKEWFDGTFDILSDTAVFGIHTSGATVDSIVDAYFYQDAENPDFLFDSTIERVGIFAAANSVVKFYGSEINNLMRGLQLKGVPTAILESNIIKDNLIGLYIDNQSGTTNLTLKCNNFMRSDDIEDADTTYGLYIMDGTTMGDIGGDNTAQTNFKYPAGNRWPVDTANSSGYPTSTGGPPIAITNWTAADKWYSIYDEAGGSPGFNYYRYNNEFVGEDDGAVYPSGIVNPVSGINAHTDSCNSYLLIPFPLERIALLDLNQNPQTKPDIYPNPANSLVYIELKGINDVTITDLVGRTYDFEKVLKNNGIAVYIQHIPSGIYLFKISNSLGKIFYEKVKIE